MNIRLQYAHSLIEGEIGSIPIEYRAKLRRIVQNLEHLLNTIDINQQNAILNMQDTYLAHTEKGENV